MIWSLDMDDFLPECSNVKFPLLRSINSEFKAASNDKKGADKMPPAEVIYHFDINKQGEKIRSSDPPGN